MEVYVSKVKIYDAMEVFYVKGTLYLPVLQTFVMLEEEYKYPVSSAGFAKNLKHKNIKHAPGDIKEYNNTPYASAPLMEKLLGADISFDPLSQTLIFSSTHTPFPIEKRWRREESQKKFDAQKKGYGAHGQDVIKGKDNFQLPFVDLAGGYFYSKDANDNRTAFFGSSVHAFGITGSWDSDLYYYDMNNFTPATLNLKTSKYSPEGDILGLFKTVEIGDIYTTSSPVSDGVSTGYGVSMSNYESESSYEKTFNIRDLLPSGWEVELYRGGELLGYQRTSLTGYYEFSDITLYPGENKFILVFYGPQGQVRRQEKIMFYRGNVLDKDKLGLRLYAVEKNKNLAHTGFDYPSYMTGFTALAEAAYGLTDTLTVRAGFEQEPVALYLQEGYEKRNKSFASGGVSLMLSPFFLNLDALYDVEENSAAFDASLQSNLYGFNLNLEDNYFDNAITTKNIYFNRIIKNTASAEVNKTIKLTKSFDFPFTLSYKNWLDTDDETQNELSFSVYQNLIFNVYGGAAYKNTVGFDDFRQEYLSFYFSKFFKGNNLRADADYSLDYNKLSTLSASFQYALAKWMDGNLRYGRNITSYQSSEYIERYGAGLNVKTAWGYFNFDAGYSSDKSVYFTAGYSLSLGYDPKGNKLIHSADKLFDTGVVAAAAYVDKNNNGVLDAGDSKLSASPFTIKPTANYGEKPEIKNGYAYFNFLKKYSPYALSADMEDMDDTFGLLDKNAAKRVRVRPGEIVHIDYPLLESGFIEGKVLFESAQTQRTAPLSGIKIDLVDAKTHRVFASTLSAHDGYYSFEKTPLGSYFVRPEQKQLNILEYTYTPCGKVDVEEKEELVECEIKIKKIQTKTKQ